MPTVEVSRTLVKSPPELWTELQGDCLRQALGAGTVTPSEDERLLVWEADDSRGTAMLEPSGWGTKVILRAEVEDEVRQLEPDVARLGLWARLRRAELPTPPPDPGPPRSQEIEQALERLLDDLGSAHRKPFQGS